MATEEGKRKGRKREERKKERETKTERERDTMMTLYGLLSKYLPWKC